MAIQALLLARVNSMFFYPIMLITSKVFTFWLTGCNQKQHEECTESLLEGD